MRFLLLGPLEVWDDGERIDIGGRKQRALLALLLLNANRNVRRARVIDWLWDEEVPRTARELVHEHVSRLRRALRHDQLAPPGSARLRTSDSGYRLEVGPDELDLHRFERLVGQAQQAAAGDDHAGAARILREALALWRGSVLEDVPPSRAVEAEQLRLEEARLTALEQRIEADLQSGGHAEIVGELEGLVAAEPLRECFRAQLMLALYRSGRQAEALAVYRAGRRLLIDGHGLEPGSRLRELEQAILRDDPALAQASPGVAEPAAPISPPSQLPPDVADFTGRAGITEAVAAMLASAPDEPEPAAPVVAVAGKPGVGKTALAVHVGHRLGSRFPDGQLWVDLRGVAPVPLDPAAALAGMLRALGVDSSGIPDELDERVRLYRSRLAGQRLLVVLDNAATEAQVRPLLPAAAGSAALVTSRCRLIGLEAAHHLDLDVLSQEEAVTLLQRVAGPGRLAADAEAAWAIARLCGHLPLALRIVGAKLAVKRHWTASEFVDRLRDEHRRLDELRAGDLEVRASVALGVQGRPPDEQRAFRLLGLLDTADFPTWAAAALLGRDQDATQELLERLADSHLLEVARRDATGQIRYRFHDLLRLYARERARADEPPEARRAALVRALGAWADLAETAADRFHPGYRPSRWWAVQPASDAAGPIGRDPRAWLEAEHSSLVAGVGQAFAGGLWELTCRLAGTLGGMCPRPGYWDDWQHTHELALEAARRAGDRRWEALLLNGLAVLQIELGGLDKAEAYAGRALELARVSGDRAQEATALWELGETHREQSHLDKAMACYQAVLPAARAGGDRHLEASVHLSMGMVAYYQGVLDDAAAPYAEALAGFRGLGDRACTAGTLNSIGILDRDRGRADQAVASYQEALELFRMVGDRRMHAAVLRNLAVVYLDQDRVAEAVPALEASLAFFSQLGDRRWRAGILNSLGDAHRLLGLPDQAMTSFRQSLAACRELAYRRGEAVNLASLGRLCQETGRLEEAAEWYGSSARLFHQIGEPRREAQSLEGLGSTLASAGRQADAVDAWRRALGILQELGAPEAAQVATRLERDRDRE
jgi:DNA-binding SARP family transcriptional activator/tetratricopeptide (TPR) repeat protein